MSDSVEPAAVTVIPVEPSKATPLILTLAAKAVAVSAFPSNAPSNFVASISPDAFIFMTGVSLLVLK